MLYPDETLYEMTDAEFEEREAYFYSYHPVDDNEEVPPELPTVPALPVTDLPF